ncbi:D-glycero-beta-D-manno-heptose-7-phosphate kinase [Rubrivivax sp. A210]|uniref:D-glycero-beta-D-manno-heptose-7-phosphate kinase n=1 Tax=Rubrivivax sp. A210 TaxID=2772301 RepID=UPI00191A5F2B|nr:D-glycero-beta-D-manno-heptose-7-phosphate kinase [Rubrivivax sp. A210]
MTAAPLPNAAALAGKRVLVVGDAMLDRYWFGSVERISPEAPVPVVRVTREEERLGGAANVAMNVKVLGAACTLLTVVGDDAPGRRLRELLENQGVTAVLGTDGQLQTVVKLRVIGRSQQLLRIDFENAPDHEVLQAMLADYQRLLPAHDLVLLSDYGKGGLTHVGQMIELARAAGLPVLVDPKGSDFSRYAGATAITPNRAELALVAGAWAGEADLVQRAQALRQRLDLQGLLLTRSEEGISLFDGAGHLRLPTQAREVFDVTGAGDTVIGVLAALMACGMSLRDAAAQANRAAGIVVSRFGTAAVTLAELSA